MIELCCDPERGFTLKRVRDMIKAYNQHFALKYNKDNTGKIKTNETLPPTS